MAAEVQTGMDKQDMKRLLMLSKKDPVNCAIGQGSDPTIGLLLLDKVRGPKAVEKELSKQIPEAKNTRFGTAFVDVDNDPKTVLFTINKPSSGLAKKLIKTLKGTGFNKVKLQLEDGTALEDFSDEEPGAVPPPGAAGAQPPAAAAPPPAGIPEPAAAPAPADGADAAPALAAAPPPDLAGLTRALTDLVKRLAQADPSRQSSLKVLAVQAQAQIKSGDAAAASSTIESLRAELGSAPAAAAPPAAANPAEIAAIGKARVAWLATRQKLETDIGKLQTEFASAFKDHAMSADLSTAFQQRVERVLDQLDTELAEKLDAVTKAPDPATHAKLVNEARQAMQRYQRYIDSDPTLTELDANPFVPLSLQKTLTATLTVLSKAIG